MIRHADFSDRGKWIKVRFKIQSKLTYNTIHCPCRGQSPSKHAGSNPEPKSPTCRQNRAGSRLPGSDFLHPSWFCSSKEGPVYIFQNRPRSNLDDLVRFWPYGSGPEASRCVRIIWPGSGRTQQSQLPVTPLSHPVACFHRRAGS